MPRKVRRSTAAGRANRPRAGDGNLAARHRRLQGETVGHGHPARHRALELSHPLRIEGVITPRRMISPASA